MTPPDHTPRSWTIVIPWDLRLTSPNQRTCWQAMSSRKRRAKDTARLCWMALDSDRKRIIADRRVRLSIVSRRSRAMDQDNVVAACKPLIDGIFNNGLTPNDSPEWLEIGSVTHETSRIPEVVFVVEEIG